MSHNIVATVLAGVSILAMTGCTAEMVEPDENIEMTAQELAADGYIVVFEPGTNARTRANSLAAAHGVAVGHVYEHSIQGFSFRGSAQAAEQIANSPNVAYVEPDGVAYAIGGKPGGGGGSTTQTTPWGITYVGGPGNGVGKTAWVIDTGIDFAHADLNVDTGRSANFARGNSADDGNGHGTHVAGTIAAIDNNMDVVGVAAGATVVAVRVLDNSGSGTISGVIGGIDYVAANAQAGDVANMSLGGGFHQGLNDAVAAAASNVKFAVAAGNDGANAANYSPASVNHNNVYTVSAVGTNGCLTSWSNWGSPVDTAAPGASILSTRNGGGTTTMSGTSMASPHVAGILLLGNVRSQGNACGDPDGNPDPLATR